MGTRSLTVIKEDASKEICVMYRQYDGYPEGHGKELADFLSGMVLTNGINLNEERRIANGMGCLAAQLVAHFKTEAGGIYLHPGGTRDCWEEYIYIVSGKEGGEPEIECWGSPKNIEPLFKGSATDMLKWIESLHER